MKWKRRGVSSLTRLHPGAHPLIIYASSFILLFWFLTFFVAPFHFFCALSLLCAICLPSASPIMPQMAFVKDGGDHRGFLSIWPQCALHLPLTAWSITHKCFLLLFGNRLPAQGSARLSELLSSLPWASAGNKSTSCICISSVSRHCKVQWGVEVFSF